MTPKFSVLGDREVQNCGGVDDDSIDNDNTMAINVGNVDNNSDHDHNINGTGDDDLSD